MDALSVFTRPQYHGVSNLVLGAGILGDPANLVPVSKLIRVFSEEGVSWQVRTVLVQIFSRAGKVDCFRYTLFVMFSMITTYFNSIVA